MSDTLSKIWASSFIMESENFQEIDFFTNRKRLVYLDEFRDAVEIPRSQAPDHIFFKLYDLKEDYKTKTPD